MASQNPSASPALPALPPASSGSEHHIALVSLNVSTIEEIIEYIISARHSGSDSIVSFHWQANQVDDLFEQLEARLLEVDERKIRRVEYDYESETVYLDITGESEFHYQVQAGLRDYLRNSLAKLLVATDDTEIRRLIRRATEQGSVPVEYENKLYKQADSEPRQYVERKVRQYIDLSDGKIRLAVVVDLQYSDVKKGWISLLAADDSDSIRHWVQHSDLFHDDDLVQPVGQVDFYLSDFVGLAGVPAAFCRPSTAEVAAGVSRKPQIILPYERLAAIFRVARSIHDPAKFDVEDGDEEENPYECLAQELIERERRMAEMKRRIAEKERHIAEKERRMAEEERRVAEMEQRVAERERRVAEELAEFERRMAERRLQAE
ncbi:hypothetical protein C8A01DRAFT_42560 [Parachaetomium inaequale]|uniref:Uncharacterized protein n=1 Tax=Parachaetomium inaequale TaxID=2588326 RepID=A0AAN6PPP3_9PEZI|nr:hypothetical protein C8A01DRAFT_42560 [Parachaetomium inaequale]